MDAADFADNHAWIDFRGPPGTFPHYSFEDVMAGRVPPDAFTGKAVVIGMTDPVNDVFVTSISSIPMPGVEVHANARGGRAVVDRWSDARRATSGRAAPRVSSTPRARR